LLDGKLVRACLIHALTVDGREVITVEGLIDKGELHPLQLAFHENYASQCGFCSPGMLMAGKALLDKNPNPTREDVRAAISGNLCRCTGYVKIIDAIMDASRKMSDWKGCRDGT
jgi:carbon-monoxide dehydrogenase small subunit